MAIYGKIRPVLALSAAVVLGLTACTFGGDARVPEKEALTWQTWSGFDDFLGLVQEQYPDIALDFISYTGANKTGYSWEQMKHDDISDIFITSQILHEEMAKERLLDLSGYEFVNQFPHGILDQVSIDGGIYLLPVNYSMYGIYYNKTLMEEKGWELPSNITELEALCEEIREEGMIPGVIGTQLTGNTFSAVFNLAKTDWLTTPRIFWRAMPLPQECGKARWRMSNAILIWVCSPRIRRTGTTRMCYWIIWVTGKAYSVPWYCRSISRNCRTLGMNWA